MNAAGLRSDELDAMLGHSEFRVTPRRGELIVFDKLARGLVNHVLLPVPTEKTKGVLVSPTIYGNVLLGPTADDVDDKTDRSTTAAGLASLMEAGARIMPALDEHEVTATYVGLRAATEHRDYQLDAHPGPALRLRGRDPLDRASPDRWRSPNGCGTRSPRRGWALRAGPTSRSSGCRTSASSAPVPTRTAS